MGEPVAPVVPASAPVPPTTTSFADEWHQWYRQAEEALTEPYGFLAMTGLTWLSREPTEVPGVPGRWHTDGESVVVDLAAGESLLLGADAPTGVRATGRVILRTDDPRRAWYGAVLVEVVRRAEGVFLRPRDPDNPRRTRFAGTPSFAPDPRWRLTGTWTPPVGQGTVSLPSALAGVTNHYGDAGTVRLDVAGRTYDLDLIRPAQAQARLVFRDATSGVTTYPNGRYVDLVLPAEPGGPLVVDLNRARNFPCSYSPQPTCPQAPARNVFAVAVTAGARYAGGAS